MNDYLVGQNTAASSVSTFRDVLFNPAIVEAGQALLGPDLLV